MTTSHLDDTRTLENLAEQNLREIEQFFVAHKRPEGDEEAAAQVWHGPKEAHEIIRKRTG
jgi:inorganic pyrophosphatase